MLRTAGAGSGTPRLSTANQKASAPRAARASLILRFQKNPRWQFITRYPALARCQPLESRQQANTIGVDLAVCKLPGGESRHFL
jgi:hypothetical protein